MRYIRFTRFIFPFFAGLLLRSGAFAQVTPQTFNCTGAPQNFVVPPCVTSVTVECWGAGGGGGGIDTYTGSPGGGGAYATKVVPVTPGQILTVIVGCGGLQGGACQGNGPGGAGGYGYGTGGNGGNSGPNGCSGPGGGGGGGSALLNGGTALVVAGGGGGGGGGGNNGDGGNGGGGGQAGSPSTSAAGGILGASGPTNCLPGSTTGNDGAGAGGGGGGVNGGGGGNVPGTDYGGSGGAGGTSLGTTVLNGNGQTPGNAGSPNLCAGCAIGGNGGSGAPGVPGDLVISYTTPVALTSNIAGTGGCGTGSATVTPTSGVGGYTYTWSPSGGNAAIASGLTAGIYTANFTDANGCTGTNTVNIVGAATITGTITTSPGTCGIATATVAASGGAGGYTYTWSPTGGNAATANLSNGSYTVAIKDAAGCTGTATTSVALPPALTLTAVHTNVTCNGLANGSATATASGGTGPYTYAWSPGPPQISMTGIATGLSGGITYTAGVQDAAGCQDTVSMTITQPAVLQQTLTATNPIICIGVSSVLNDAVAGGTAPYNVTWSSGGSFVGAAGTTTVSPATTTTYSASVLDANNCANTATVTVTVNPLPTLTVNSATICAGSVTTLTVTGANTYAWSPATGLSGTTGTSVTANPTITTVYTITGTDVNTCTNTATSTVTVNSLPNITATTGAICVGGTTTLTANGASTYAWSPATGLSPTTGSVVTANPATTTNYTITGTDANNCVNTATSTVTVNALPTVTVTSGAICSGSSISVTAGGATSYAWSPSASLSSPAGNSVTAFPGTTTVYTVTGTDANNCVNTATSTITVNALPTATAGSNSPICVTQTLNLISGGGTTYAWTGPNTFTSSTQNPSIAATTTVNAGTYTVLVTDANNCQATATATVSINTLPVVAVNSATICAGSSTTLTATGAISYTWSPATGLSSAFTNTVTANPLGTTDYTITGDNGCTSTGTATVTVNPLPVISASSATVCPTFSGTLTATGASTYTWSTGTISPTVSIAPPSTTVYTVVGTDVKNCISLPVTGTITVNPALVLTIGGTTPICQGATLNLTVNPGVAWIWQGPNAYSSFSQNPSIPNAQPNMSATYSVGAQDANGCTDTAFINIVVNPTPTVTASNNWAICSNQTVNFTGIGGTTYTWTGPGSFNVIGQNPVINNAPVTASGIYTLTATDANNCVSTDTTLVTVNPTPTVTVNSPVICIGYSVTLTPTGVAPGGTYTWVPSPDLSSGTGSPVATPTTTSSYSVTGINTTGCIGSATCIVTVNPLPTVTVNSGTICAGKNTTLQAANANTYSWTPSIGLSNSVGSTVIASPAASATYIVTGTDINGCTNVATALVHVNPLPSIIASPGTTSGCEPLCISFVNTGLSNGVYSWSFGDGKTDNTAAPTHCFSQGTYSVIVQLVDSNGCLNTSTANVIAFPTPIANFNSSPQPTTILDPNIDFTDATSGGATLATWGWNFGDGHVSLLQNPSHTYLDTGTFAVQLVVKSNLGCADTIVINVIIDDEYLIYVPNAFSPNFDGVNDVFMPKGEGVTSYKLYVYDRWGSLAFSSNNIMSGWDGTHLGKGGQIAQEDVYIWKIEAKNKKGQPKILKGTVSLVK